MGTRRPARWPSDHSGSAVIHKYVFDPTARQLRPLATRVTENRDQTARVRTFRWVLVTLALGASALCFDAVRSSANTAAVVEASAP
ncbi:MAG: hypothetical protein K0V04_34690 [Deltaproteobacteria bacterium]|nr:hypothetical protein [Deltaproteobacteria bacterium]